MDRLLLKPEEAAQQLGLGRTKFYALMGRGEIPGVVRIGKNVRISSEALRQWVREQAKQSTSEVI